MEPERVWREGSCHSYGELERVVGVSGSTMHRQQTKTRDAAGKPHHASSTLIAKPAENDDESERKKFKEGALSAGNGWAVAIVSGC